MNIVTNLIEKKTVGVGRVQAVNSLLEKVVVWVVSCLPQAFFHVDVRSRVQKFPA